MQKLYQLLSCKKYMEMVLSYKENIIFAKFYLCTAITHLCSIFISCTAGTFLQSLAAPWPDHLVLWRTLLLLLLLTHLKLASCKYIAYYVTKGLIVNSKKIISPASISVAALELCRGTPSHCRGALERCRLQQCNALPISLWTVLTP